MRFLDFPEWMQILALFIDSDDGLLFVVMAIMHVVVLAASISKKVRASKIHNALTLVVMALLPIITIFSIYVAGLPKG